MSLRVHGGSVTFASMGLLAFPRGVRAPTLHGPLDNTHCGMNVTPIDILARRSLNHQHADALRMAVAALTAVSR